MERKSSYLYLLLGVIKSITSNLNPEEVLDLIARRIPEVVGVDAATIRLLDASGKKLILHAASGLSDTYLDRGPVDAEEIILKALEGMPIAIYDASNDPRVQYPEAAAREGIKSILAAPIPIHGKVAGVLRLLTRSPRAFDQEEIDFVAALAEQCGIAIDNARAYEAQEQQLKYFQAIYDTGKKINATGDLNVIFDFIVTRLTETMRLKGCTLRLMAASSDRMELKAAHGLSQQYLDRGPLDDEMATFYILQGEPVLIPDATVDIHTLYHKEAQAEGVGSVLAVPIIVQDETIGMIRLLTGEVRQFTHADIKFAMAIAEQTGLAIQSAMKRQ